MHLTAITPVQALDKPYRLQNISREQVDKFKTEYKCLFSRLNEKESEENAKNHLMDFLKSVYYTPDYLVAPKGKTDFVIHTSKEISSPAGILFETKWTGRKSEMVTRQNLNVKAMHELILYYFRERIESKNNNIRHCVITNFYEWFVFDAMLFERLFYKNTHLAGQYKAWKAGQMVSTNNDLFYNEIVKPFLDKSDEELTFTYFDLREYAKTVDHTRAEDDRKLAPLYKLLSPTHLLKLPSATDSNKLNPKFYLELLHLIGLEEVREGSKKLIRRKELGKRDAGSLLENTITTLETEDIINRFPDRTLYGETRDEQVFTVALELCITWMNRILFLKLLESQLIKYHGKDKSYSFLNASLIKDFDVLNKLFFQVLARKTEDRTDAIKRQFGKIPYLNSSLFEISVLEGDSIRINSLDDSFELPLYRNSVLRNNKNYKNVAELNTLYYLFAFLDSYDFSSESLETVQEKNRPLINASVLGLIFEKINGYKDGSFYTPGFITEYMCREAIRKAVIQKFNDIKGWNCTDITALYNKLSDSKEANRILNEVRICDPAVGSGHYLVSALNELLAIKSELEVLQDANGKRLREYTVNIVNYELVVLNADGSPFEYCLNTMGIVHSEIQRVQKTLFHEKQTIIENCLFGVDINPNSVKICRLRLWIELLKHAYYTEESKFTELETLPNIDINIKEGNSLLRKFSLTEDLTEVFQKQKFSPKTYKNSVKAYIEAKDKNFKKELEDFIQEIKSQFSSTVSNRDPRRKKLASLRGRRELLENNTDLFGHQIKDEILVEAEKVKLDSSIQQVANEIAEAENNVLYKGSFEWRFEFPEVLDEKGNFVGFDVVIGNPPYIPIEAFNEGFRKYLKDKYKCFDRKYETSAVFIYEGLTLLKPGGVLSFISPMTWQTGENYLSFRKVVVADGGLKRVINLPFNIFEDAFVDTAIYFFLASKTDYYEIYNYDKKGKADNLRELSFDIVPKAFLSSDYKLILNTTSASFVNRFSGGAYVPLGQITKSTQGLSGSEFLATDLKTPKTLPYFQKGVVKNYVYKLESSFSTDMTDKASLLKFYLAEPKVLIRRIISRQDRLMVGYTEDAMVFKKDVNPFIPTEKWLSAKYLLAVLASRLISYIYLKSSAIATKDDFRQTTLSELRQIPIKKIEPVEQQPFIEKVNLILTAKAENPDADTTELEKEIDDLVYSLYNLTDEEKKIIEGKTN